MACLDFNEFKQFIIQFDQKVAIDKDKDKPLRYNVWNTTSEEVADITNSGKLPKNSGQSPRILRKIESAVRRLRESNAKGGSTQKDIFNHKFNIEMSIGLHELMESVKGEADKARNMGIEVSEVSDSGVLPALPKSRIAASIGRKIAFQKGYRFKRATTADSAAKIEAMYYDIGNAALIQLEKAGYVKASNDIATIFDYQNPEDLKKDFTKNDPTRSDVLSISLNEKKLGIKPNTPESAYFLKRSDSDLTDTDLGMVTEKLRLANLITQPATIVLPDTGFDAEGNKVDLMDDKTLAQWDDGINEPDDQTAAARKAIYKKPMYVNKAIHRFMQLMNEESVTSGKSATQIINNVFGTRKNMINSLFGLKRSDDYSIDRKESVSGQNLSKTTPLDDLVEYYDLLQIDGNPAPLHMQMKLGRNARLYYMNSVLNPHASKQSRYMLTPGEYTIDTGSADFDYLVYGISQSLKIKDKNGDPKVLTYDEIMGGTELDAVMAAFDKFQGASNAINMMKASGPLIKKFPGLDYVTILTSLQAIKDVRNPKGGKVTTEFTVSADATASGGTLTFMQAMGTNPNVTEFLQRIGLLNSDETLEKAPLKDLYGLMSNAITDYVKGEGAGLGPDLGEVDVTEFMQDTLDLLFNGGKDIREFSKDPTMVFVYGQGRNSATKTIAASLANRIIDNLDDPSTREYLSVLFDDKSYLTAEGKALKDIDGLYPDIVQALVKSELPQQMFDTMKENIKDEYLQEYIDRSQAVYDFMKQLPADTAAKILPAGAVLDGKTATLEDLNEFGMPITKKTEVLNKFEGKDDTVLTRVEKLQKTVMDVSTTHGIDAALLYHSLANVDPKTGVVVIHDDVRGSVSTVRAMEAEYALTAIRVASEYDVHQQVMNSVEAYSPEIAATPEFQALKKQIDDQVAEKKKIISALFNKDSDALIGDGTAFEAFANPKAEGDKVSSAGKESTIPDESAEAEGRTPKGAASEGGKVNSFSEEETLSPSVEDQSRGRVSPDTTEQAEAKPRNAEAPSTKDLKDSSGQEPLFYGDAEKNSPAREAELLELLRIDDITQDTYDALSDTPDGSNMTEAEREAKLAFEKRYAAPLYLTRETAEAAMAKLAEGSEIISRFLAAKTGGIQKIFLDAFTNSFFADADTINLTGEDPRGHRLNLNNEADLKKQREILEHEITHANTTAFLIKSVTEQNDPAVQRDLKYMLKAMGQMAEFNPDNLSAETISRIAHMLGHKVQMVRLAEFIAIMNTESAVAGEIYAELDRMSGGNAKTLRGRIEALLAKVSKWISGLKESDLKEWVDIDKLAGALARTIDQGTEFREQQYEESLRYAGQVETEFKYGSTTGIAYARKASFDYLNYAVSSMLNSRLERKGKNIMGNLHRMLSERYPLYVEAADKAVGLYEGSPAMQQFIHTVTGENVNKVKKADVLAKFAEINSQRTETINAQISQMHALSKDLSKQDIKDLESFVDSMPLHDYFVLAAELTTAEEIEAEAELLRKKLWKVNTRAVLDVDTLIDWNVGIWNEDEGKLVQTQTGNIYNLSTKYPPGRKYPTSEFQVDLRKLLALESIKRLGAKKFEKLLGNKELIDVIKDNSVANALATLDIEGTESIRDSLVSDYWKEPFQIKAVREKDFRMYEYGEETGWKVLKAPTRNELGIVYKPTIDSTDIAGAYTDMKLGSTDVNVPRNLKGYKGVVEHRNGYKLLLSADQKAKLGLIRGFEQGLVRSTAHSMAAQESEIIRNSILQDDTWMAIGKAGSEKELEGIIEASNVDNPWFLKLEEGTAYNKLSKEIRAKYMPVGNRASNVRGFNDKVDLVRKDISHWLLGGSAKSLFQNPQMKWATRILKNLVSGAKIGMVVLNPVKIANDNLSNLTYLGVIGVDPLFIAKNYAEIQKDFGEYTNIQRQVFQLKLQLVARPESSAIKKKLKNLQKRLTKNSVGDIGNKGFVNSLGSDLVSRSADTLSGFQADMHRSLEYLLTDKSGNKNIVSHFIVELQKIGYQAEDFFGYLGDIASKSKSTSLLEQELDMVADRIRKIKTEDDIVNYVAQFTTSPSSEAVRFGSAMTDLTDVLAKETLYRHLTQNKGMDPSDARIEVLDSFPDYKENMPLAVKTLSDMGIIMFPSFWLRIQKIIYRMARDKPVSLATELMIQEMIGSDINTIFEANVINKADTFGGLLHTPFEAAGVNSAIPMHLF